MDISIAPFYITRKVAIRRKKRCKAICFMVERIAGKCNYLLVID